MEKIVTIQWEDMHGNMRDGDTIVEYVEYMEDDKKTLEVTNVFLPDGIAEANRKELRKQAVENFYICKG